MADAGATSTVFVSVDADLVRFAQPGTGMDRLRDIEERQAGTTATFTDALIGYAERHDAHLNGCQLYMSVAGAMTGGTVRTTSGRWFISVDGLRAMTGVAPVVVNDVTALAWATLDGRGTPFGGPVPQHDARDGRHSILFAGTGLGASCVDRRGDRVVALDSEAGHMPFAADNEAEWRLASRAAALLGQATYENVAIAAAADRHADLDLLATVLGRYAGATTVAFGAWDRAFLCGPLFDRIRQAGKGAPFRAAFEGRGKMRGPLRQVPTLTSATGLSSLAGLSRLAERKAMGA